MRSLPLPTLLVLTWTFGLFIACGDSGPNSPDAGSAAMDGSAPIDGGATSMDGGSTASSIGPLTGFSSAANGFAFQNYTNQMGAITNLTPVEFRRVFGDQVCERVTQGEEGCVLTLTAARAMNQSNAMMNGGHCEGMAVLSLLLYHGIEKAQDLGAATVGSLSLMGNTALQRKIAQYYVHQFAFFKFKQLIRRPASEIIDQLAPTFQPGATENYTIAFFKRNGTGGHAVTPYGIRDNGNGTTSIQVYDNNFPNQERAIVVNRASNQWQYEAAANPGNPASIYTGDATTNNLALIPLSLRLKQQPCFFCGNVSAAMMMAAPRRVASIGNADLLIADEQGRRIGQMGDELVNEIPGAEALPHMSDDLWNDDQDPIYEIPGGSQLSVEISGRELETAEPTTVSVSGPGYYVAVLDIELDPMQVDNVVFARDRPSLTYTTEGAETAIAFVAFETDAADWSFAIRSRGDSAGQSIELDVDFERGNLRFVLNGDDEESEFDVVIERSDDDQTLTFFDEDVVADNGAIYTLDYTTFDQDGETLLVSVDSDGDGTIDEMVNLIDER